MGSLKDGKHTFLITGASSGLGLAIALDAAQNGHTVIGTARNVTRAKEQHPEFVQAGGRWMQLDLTASNTQELVSETIEGENVDILVNNAGYGLYGSIEDERFVQHSPDEPSLMRSASKRSETNLKPTSLAH